MKSAEELQDIAKDLRLDMFKMFYKSGTGHLAPAFSCIDIFTVLYFAPIINWAERFSEKRDRVILSKGHACAALYAVLAKADYFPHEELMTFYHRDTLLGGHPNVELNGIESATGSLGHGICFATGTAMAGKLATDNYMTYVVVGDGECEEGSVWEAAMFAANHKLDNMVVILDNNGLQASDSVELVAPLGAIEDKWKSFGWHTVSINGHDYKELEGAFSEAMDRKGKPTIIIANTVKGKGLAIAENNKDWHSRAPKGIEWREIEKSYSISIEELAKV